MGQATITVDFGIDDRLASVKALLDRLQPALGSAPADRVSIDVSRSRYLGPSAAAILVAVAARARGLGCRVDIALPTTPPELAAYCSYSGLMHEFAGRPLPVADHPQCETIPVAQFFHERPDQPEPLMRLIRRHMDATPDEEDYLRMSLGEVFRNVDDHSKSAIGGYWTARYLSGSGEVRCAIVDLGEGIGTTLRRKHPEIPNTAVALQRVLVGGISAKSIETNLGLGISNLSGMVRQMEGELVIVTEDSAAEVRFGDVRPNISSLGFRFPGTAVMFKLRVRGSEQS